MKESISPQELEKRIKRAASENLEKKMDLDASISEEEIEEAFDIPGVKKGKDWEKAKKRKKLV